MAKSMYKLIIKQLTNGWHWRYYFRGKMLAKSARGYGDISGCKKAFSSFARSLSIHPHTIIVEKPNEDK